jgi:hypothetical protein
MHACSVWPVSSPVVKSVAAAVGPHCQAVFAGTVDDGAADVAAVDADTGGEVGTVNGAVVPVGAPDAVLDGAGDPGAVSPFRWLSDALGAAALPVGEAASAAATRDAALGADAPREPFRAKAATPATMRTASTLPVHARRRRDLLTVALSRAARWPRGGAGGVGQVAPSGGAVLGPAGVSQPIPVTVCCSASRSAGPVGALACIPDVTEASVAWGIPGAANGTAGAAGAGVREPGRRSAAASCAAVGRAAGSLARQAEISRHKPGGMAPGRSGAVCR